MRSAAPRSALLPGLLLLVLAGCEAPPMPGAGEATPGAGAAAAERIRSAPSSPAFRQAIERGNDAYTAENWEAARAAYSEAAELDPGEAAGWFGLYMVARKLGDEDGAQAAMDRVRSLTGEGS